MEPTYSVLIVDDELHGRENLEIIISENFKNLKILSTCSDAFEARNKIQALKPEIVFLDINMDKVNGLELLETFTDRKFETIFVTAYKNYALEALKLGAIGYILKPIILSELREVVSNAITQLELKYGKQKSIKPAKTLTKSASNEPYQEKLMITHTGGYSFVKVIDIVKLEALNNYCKIYLSNGDEITTSKTLKSLQEQLDPNYFFRVHKTFLVNLNHVKAFKSKGVGVLILKDETEVKVAVLKRALVKKQLTHFINA